MQIFSFFKVNHLLKCFQQRRFLSARKLVLGIESSCDDTGAAVVDENGTVLGEGFQSQMQIHLDFGGVIPHFAALYHSQHIKSVVDAALSNSNVTPQELTAIAVTTRPGLKASLAVGMDHAMKLARDYQKPLIPIHHMEAHALTVRLQNEVPFPFLCLLASGGHCQLTLIKGVDEFYLLGDSQHNSPGEVLDKIARRLKLQNLPECCSMSGGKAIEFMARNGDPTAYKFPLTMTTYRDCNFSFSGFSSFSHTFIEEEENRYDIPPDGVITSVSDFCASLLHGYALHLIHRIHRAFAFCEQQKLMGADQRTLVFSGGVACNSYLRKALEQSCKSTLNSKFFVPPTRFCTDNGVMIAWNGMERLKLNLGIVPCMEDLQIESDCPLGIDIRDQVKKADIKIRSPKLTVQNESDIQSQLSV